MDLKKLEPQPQQIELAGSDGNKIIGWYFKSKATKPKARLLFFHGNAENISSHFIALHWILKHDYDYFIFDYPGYGGSEGEPTQKSTTEAGRVSLEWLAKTEPKTPLVIFGQSLGGNVALYTAATSKDIPVCLVAVESTFKSYRKVGQRVLAGHWWTWPFQWLPYVVTRDKVSAQDHIAEISPTPLLVIHGDEDDIVGIENGEDVFASAREPKKFLKVPEGKHIQAFTGHNAEEYQRLFLQELNKQCAPQPKR
ncbi:alpha/beta hydrolase [Bdellovibrio bacteriovorus]|uniref:alpha/beta hydrolase n=1 Tax=Bdellovibrio bacteriovorus TaxID=959 RepID=UPI0035A611AB